MSFVLAPAATAPKLVLWRFNAAAWGCAWLGPADAIVTACHCECNYRMGAGATTLAGLQAQRAIMSRGN